MSKNLQLTNLSVQFPNEWSVGSVSANFQQRVQGGRLSFSGSLTLPMDEIANFENLSISEISDEIARRVMYKIENGEIVTEPDHGHGME